MAAISDNPGGAVSERDWVFARRFTVRRMIERGDTSAADRVPDIPEYGAMQDEIECLRRIVRKQTDRLEDCKRFVGSDRVSVIFEDYEFPAFLAALDRGCAETPTEVDENGSEATP